ncbi:MAG: DUF362 domain-containing protein [Deltaproteobacteria bacterium]|nr:DUF362 domain-containing protein [Deltaproteobacteria bacterium]
MTKVALLKCRDYDEDLLIRTIKDGLAQIGFDLAQFHKARVGLKPNLLMAANPDKAVATHPSFFKAVAKIVMENGGTPVLTECHGFGSFKSVMNSTGYSEVVKELGMEVGKMDEIAPLHYPQAKLIKRIDISKAFFDVDMILSLPKFKTHGFTYMSGAVKNLFGTIPGLRKARMHLRFPQPMEFSQWLLDLNGALLRGFDKPKKIIHIMDAVIGQEGEGPGPSGTPREIGAIIIGSDPVAVDYVASGVVGLDYKKIPTIMLGFKRDFAVSSPEDISIIGHKVEDMRVINFQPTKSSISSHFLRGWLVSPTVKNIVIEKPWPNEEKCTLCYKCKSVCPAGAISNALENKKIPEYNYKKCIRCYCCIEFCPEAAISLKKGKLQWLLGL